MRVDRSLGFAVLEIPREPERFVTEAKQLREGLRLEPDVQVAASLIPDDTRYRFQWGPEEINAPQAWDFSLGSASVVLAVLDTGVDYTHEDLAPNMWRDGSGAYGYDFVNGDTDPRDDNIHSYDDGQFMPNTNTYHGTHVAGIAAAATNNNLGIAGMAQVRIMAVKILNASGIGSDSDVASGIQYAMDNGANIVVLSFGASSSTFVLRRAVERAWQAGLVLVAAAGNEGASAISYPAAYAEVIAVGAVDSSLRRASFSNTGPDLDLVAPGVQIISAEARDRYQYLSGTSSAAPHVAGVAALMLSQNPALTNVEISAYLNQSARDLGPNGFDTSYGWGLVDANAAVSQVSAPAARITVYPAAVERNATIAISWVVSGRTMAGSGQITTTYLRWGSSAGNYTSQGRAFTGSTPQTFSDSATAPSVTQTLYFTAYAVIDGQAVYASEVQVDVVLQVPVDPLKQLQEFLTRFFSGELPAASYVLAFLVFGILIAVAVAIRHRRRVPAFPIVRAPTPVYAPVYMPPPMAHPTAPIIHAEALPTPPPPEPVPGAGPGVTRPVPAAPFGAPVPAVTGPVGPPQALPHLPPPAPPKLYLVEISHWGLHPATLSVSRGSAVQWANRDWAPPPGNLIRSGLVDRTGEHFDGQFSSPALIPPGTSWRHTFQQPGIYYYYLAGRGVIGQIIVTGI